MKPEFSRCLLSARLSPQEAHVVGRVGPSGWWAPGRSATTPGEHLPAALGRTKVTLPPFHCSPVGERNCGLGTFAGTVKILLGAGYVRKKKLLLKKATASFLHFRGRTVFISELFGTLAQGHTYMGLVIKKGEVNYMDKTGKFTNR